MNWAEGHLKLTVGEDPVKLDPGFRRVITHPLTRDVARAALEDAGYLCVPPGEWVRLTPAPPEAA
jgi:hypothetical protein